MTAAQLNFIENAIDRFEWMKQLAEDAINQIMDDDLYWIADNEANSIAILIQHLGGNMLSRWTDFLTTDGEKEWRNRDGEFERPDLTRTGLMNLWERGWQCLFDGMKQVTPDNLTQTITIRGQGLTITDAILRQLTHHSYHTGQIVMIAKLRVGDNWKTLSIPRGQSKTYVPKSNMG